jgi:CubicO group peptidase (beta-lactamase class C family)
VTNVDGTCDPRFAAVRDAFAGNFAAGTELGASLCIAIAGRAVVDLWGGYCDEARTRAWQRDTVACAFSCTKGIVAMATLSLVARGILDLDEPVALVWPEFAAEGKAALPLRWLLTHEAGLPAIDRRLPFGSLSDWDRMTAALAAQAPCWEPGTAHGYHGVTFGHLVGEVMRRATGEMPADHIERALCTAADADFSLGLRAADERRCASVVMLEPPAATFFDHWEPGGLGARSFQNPSDCNSIEHVNSRAFRAAQIPAANGHTNARGLERLYRAFAAATFCGPELVAEAGRAHVSGDDLVMALPTAFGLGFEVSIPEFSFGPGPATFGHNGSGGSLGMYDPDADITLGYVMNNLRWTAGRSDERWDPIFAALYGALS